ncbi:tetratricopeptide repeat protein [bacterium]|nr:tetratricopeptide repeat protein [bacterium]
MSRKVLLVGWDAADWKIARPMVEAGAMPNLARLMKEGVSGNIATLHPPLSPMLWTSISTGKRPPKHGIMGFSEVTPDGKSVRPVTIQSRRTKALWNILSQNGKKSIVVGWWPSHPAEPIDGVVVSDWFRDVDKPDAHLRPVVPGSVHPPELIPQIRDLRVSPYEIDGAMLRAFVPDFEKVDQEKDKSLHALAKILCEGLTINAVATELLATQEWDFAAVYFDAIDHFGHRFMAYHPPHTQRADEKIAELYRHVVANGYAWHDAMLGELIATAGDDVTVILMSDHGFHSDHLRPNYIPAEGAGPAVEHRHFGMLAMAGPGIKKTGGAVYGAILTDICPTILRLFDLPAGADMDGKVLADSLANPELLPAVPSWDDVAGPNHDGRLAKDTVFDPGEAADLHKRLQDLGYVDPLEDDMEKNIASTLREWKYNEGRALLEARETGKAVESFRSLVADEPTELRFIEHLVDALLSQDDSDGAREVITNFVKSLETALPAAIEKLHSQSEEAKVKSEELLEKWRKRDENPLDTDTNPEDGVEAANSGDAAASEPVKLSPEKRKELQSKAFLRTLYQARNEDEARHLITDDPDIRKLYHDNRKLAELATGYALPIAMLNVRTLLHPSSPRSDEDRAIALEALDQIEKARERAERGSVDLASHWLALGEFEKADSICEKALEIDSENHRALAVLAESAWRQGHVAKAVEAASESVSLLWFQPSMHLLIGLGLERLGEPENAARMLESALKLSPMLVRAHAALGRLYAQPPLNQPVLAMRHKERAEELRAKIREKNAAWTVEAEKALADEAAAVGE